MNMKRLPIILAAFNKAWPRKQAESSAMMVPSIRALLAAALLCLGAQAQAHRFHAGITDIAFNQKTGSTEIVHTYMAHDVEALLANLYQRQFDLSQPEDEAILRKYLEKRFYLQAQDNSRLPVRWVGLTVDAESIVIYQEIENTPLSKTARIHDGMLVDFMPDQSNTINLNDSGMIRTFTFDQNNLEQGVR
jgi:hypothetical protein